MCGTKMSLIIPRGMFVEETPFRPEEEDEVKMHASPSMLALVAMVLVLSTATWLNANTITFTDITIASGTIGSTSFTNEPITIVAIGDTSNIQSCQNGA